MSLINKDFSSSSAVSSSSYDHERPKRVRWFLLGLAVAGISVVIASTGTQTSASKQVASTSLESIALPDLEKSSQSVVLESQQIIEPEKIALDTSDITRDSHKLSLPELQASQQIIDETHNEPPKQWRDFRVKSGDNLARLFKRAEIRPQQLDELMKSGHEAKTLTKIFPKDVIRVLTDDEGNLQALHYDIDYESYLLVERKHGLLVPKIHKHDIEVRTTNASGVIESSLFLAAQESGISQNVIMELAGIFGWDIDFSLDIRKGDSFTLIYEEHYKNGEKIKDGDILAAEFVNDGNTYRAVRYTNPQTNVAEYFTDDGKSMRKAFLRSPVNFARISSRFTLKRYHPVLHKFRAHKGVDYAAKRGTPIRAAGDGKVIFKGKKGGYGKVLILQHGTKYTTLYAHLNSYNKKLRNGSKVKQGQTIAYVGSSGLATGPHLHYEFRVNGVHRNPLTVKLPEAKPVPERFMVDFKNATHEKLAELDTLVRANAVARTDSAETSELLASSN